jgi:NAD(P)-dependent dehydrogenase (short-subunit alcohol dehydrogenase family)
MVKLDVVRTENTTLVQSQPLVAVFFGGTSGIGHYTLRALATAEANGGKGFRAYIVGRKAAAAEDIISECRGICPQGQFKFVKADDLSLIRDVDRVCADIIQLEEKEGQDARIDYLMMSQGGSIFLPRKGMFKVSIVIAFLKIV